MCKSRGSLGKRVHTSTGNELLNTHLMVDYFINIIEVLERPRALKNYSLKHKKALGIRVLSSVSELGFPHQGSSWIWDRLLGLPDLASEGHQAYFLDAERNARH